MSGLNSRIGIFQSWSIRAPFVVRLFLCFSRLDSVLEPGSFVLLLELSFRGRFDDLFESHNVSITLFILFRTVLEVTVGMLSFDGAVFVQL